MAYKAELKEQTLKLFNAFFDEERGNRVTSNNLEGLALKFSKLLDDNEIKKEKDEHNGPKRGRN